MSLKQKPIVVCSCEGTIPLDRERLAQTLPGNELHFAEALCVTQHDALRDLAQDADTAIVACTHQAALLREIAAETNADFAPVFCNIREAAGWGAQASAATPKIAALLALAAQPQPDIPMVTIESQGVVLVYGVDETAIEAGRQLADELDVTVVLAGTANIAVPVGLEFQVVRGRIRTARGVLGSFDLDVDGFATPVPSSRGTLRFGLPRDGANSNCDILLDLSGGKALFPADTLRPGYVRADPRDGITVAQAIAKVKGLVGTFDKPRYVTYRPDLCAHSRSRITGCTRCLDVCPTGAITPAGDHVAIDAAICAGCGSCAAVCPTGAASYALPPADMLLQRLRTVLMTYGAAGGKDAVILFHDREHGEPLINALSHFGDGLPAHVIPISVNETTQICVEAVAAALAYGAAGVAVLTSEKPAHDTLALQRTLVLANSISKALGHDEHAVTHIETDDPDRLAQALSELSGASRVASVATFLPVGNRKSLLRLTLNELRTVSPSQPQSIALDAGAPFGRIILDGASCTLCMSCVSACPADALSANADRPQLAFREDLCIQCGLCANTCPERAIRLEPRLSFGPEIGQATVLKQEEPHACDRCGKEFGIKSSVARIREKLAGKHWMFTGANADRLALIGLCDDCRAIAATENRLDPYAGAPRPKPRTAEDYLRERQNPTDDDALG